MSRKISLKNLDSPFSFNFIPDSVCGLSRGDAVVRQFVHLILLVQCLPVSASAQAASAQPLLPRDALQSIRQRPGTVAARFSFAQAIFFLVFRFSHRES